MRCSCARQDDRVMCRGSCRHAAAVCDRMTEDGSIARLCTYARISSAEVPYTMDIMDGWEDPSSFFLMSGTPPPAPPFLYPLALLPNP